MGKTRLKVVMICFLGWMLWWAVVTDTNAEVSALSIDYYQEALTFDSEGNLFMNTRDKRATSGIRYKTLGWIIKKKNQPMDAPGNLSVRIKLEMTGERPDPENSAYIYCSFQCDKNTIFERISSASEEWADELYLNGGNVYLDAIMTVVENGVQQGSMDSNGNCSGEVYFTYEGIAYARDWSSRTGLLSHYNKSLVFPAVPKMLGGEYSVHFMEIEHGDDSNPKSLERYGKDINKKRLKKKKRTFQAEDFSDQFFVYKKAKIIRKNYSESPKESTKTAKEFSIDNTNGKIEKLEVIFYYERIDKEEHLTHNSSFHKENSVYLMNVQFGSYIKKKEKFDVSLGIPSGEAVYAFGNAGKYWYTCKYVRKYGYRSVGREIHVKYHLKWKNSLGETKKKTETIKKTYYVDRPFSYWTIEDLELYVLSEIKISNSSLKNKSILIPNQDKPSISFVQDSSVNHHMIVPDCSETVVIEKTITGTTAKPEIPEENYQSTAENHIGEIQVRNDWFQVDGDVFLADTLKNSKTAAPVCLTKSIKSSFYKEEIQIDEMAENQKYQSTMDAIYMKYLGNREIVLKSLNASSIFVHTPVYCDGKIEGQIKYNQQIHPAKNASLILGKEFEIQLSMRGTHRDIKGYQTRDYSEYSKRRQVKFPFPVYYGSGYYEKNVWITFQGEQESFFLPSGVKEGDYEVVFRSIARNAGSSYETGVQKNLNTMEYAALDRVLVTVVGRLYGFQIIDIADYPRWQSVFRKSDKITPSGKTYTVGMKNPDGNLLYETDDFTLPVMEGSHPFNRNVKGIAMGVPVCFKIYSIGSFDTSDCYIRILPTFYHLSKSGGKSREVEVYYQSQNGSMIKMGSMEDATKVHLWNLSDSFSMMNASDRQRTASLLGKTESEIYGNGEISYSYSILRLREASKILCGTVLWNVKDVNTALKSRQCWYGVYNIPKRVYVVEKGKDLRSYFQGKQGKVSLSDELFLREGFLLVNFDIEIYRDGKGVLSYINSSNAEKGYCNMWEKEGFFYAKTTSEGKHYYFKDGDALVYDLSENGIGNYIGKGTH